MLKGKYSTLLTVLLVVAIIAIIIIVLVLGINTFKSYIDEKDAKQAKIQTTHTQQNDDDAEEEPDDEEDPSGLEGMAGPGENNTNNNDNNNENKINLPKVQYYKNYAMVGNIEIPKTKASYPILLDKSPAALEIAVSVTYPSSPKLNKPGNTVIIGHNYRNGKLFAKNDELEIGDTIKITDLDGNTLTYTIYEIFETVPTDTEYMTRDRGDNIEISLSTCTDDGNNRLVILARVEQ